MNGHRSGWALADLIGDVLEFLFDLAENSPLIAIVIVLCVLAWLIGKAHGRFSTEAQR